MDYRIRKSPMIKKAHQASAILICIISLLLLISGNARGSGNASGISATLEPPNITLGNMSVLSLHISGSRSGKPVMPHVDGLRFIPAGQSSEYKFINGKVSASVSFIYRVVPDRTGYFNIPPIMTDTDDQIKTESLTLHVAGSQKSGANTAQPPAQQPQQPENTTKLEKNEIGETAFLRVTPATHKPYVGETVPVKISAYFRRGVRATVNSLPVPNGNAFSFQSVSGKPRQTEEIIDGKAFSVLTWNAVMSAVKEGEYPFGVHMDVTLLVPDRSRRRSSFGNSFFDDSFLTASSEA